MNMFVNINVLINKSLKNRIYTDIATEIVTKKNAIHRSSHLDHFVCEYPKYISEWLCFARLLNPFRREEGRKKETTGKTMSQSINQPFGDFFDMSFSSLFLHVNFIILSIFSFEMVFSFIDMFFFAYSETLFSDSTFVYFSYGTHLHRRCANKTPKNEIYSLNDLYVEYFDGGVQICDSFSIQ